MLDAQSLKDLDVPALLNRLDYCRTKGGKARLAALAQLEECTYHHITARQAAVRYLAAKSAQLPLQLDEQDVFYVMQYLGAVYDGDDAPGGKLAAGLLSVKKFLFNKDQYYAVLSGIQSVARMCRLMQELVHVMQAQDAPPLLKTLCADLHATVERLDVASLGDEPPISRVFQADRHLRVGHNGTVRQLLRLYYELEAYCSLAHAHVAMQLVFPRIGQPGEELKVRGLYHPLVQRAVANHIDTGVKHLVIITGPNMSGKSTMMKSLGLAFLMAYLGMGVAAEDAVIPVVSRIITFIDIRDDLSLGYSYFLSEVKRVKTILAAVAAVEPLLVICDELFRGTNVQDALECNELVVHTFLRYPQHYYFLATHHTAIAEKFATAPVCYTGCFEGAVTPGGIAFSYTWQPGISAQRIGLHILRRELSGNGI